MHTSTDIKFILHAYVFYKTQTYTNTCTKPQLRMGVGAGVQGECSWTVEDTLAVELRELYLSDKLLNTVHIPSGK